MSRHSFDPEVAEKVGLAAAVIYQNIAWWCEKNAANEKHIHEGRAWTYNSMAAFSALFPYLTAKQIRDALQVLRDSGLVVTGNFNSDPRDRTLWYSISGQLHLPSGANATAPEGRPLPDSKPSLSKPITPTPAGQVSLFPEKEAEKPKDESDVFDAFWALYPKCERRTDKPKAREAFWKIIHGKHKHIPKTEPHVILDGLRAYARTGPDPQYIPLPTTWLNGARWENAPAGVGQNVNDFWRGQIER